MTGRKPAEPDDRIRAERMDAASQTARVLAHEIANHLGSMRTMLQLLAEELGPDHKGREDLQILVEALDGATRLVEALRAFARAPALGAGPADLNAVVGEAEPVLRALLRPGTSLGIDLAKERLVVLADAPRLAQLVRDLVVGASHSLPAGGRIQVTTRRSPRSAGRAPAASLAVRDDGPGFEPEAAARIFEPYVFDVTHDAGLRLPAIFNAVTRSGGTISARSAPGAGTVINVILPLASAARRAAP